MLIYLQNSIVLVISYLLKCGSPPTCLCACVYIASSATDLSKYIIIRKQFLLFFVYVAKKRIKIGCILIKLCVF